MQTQSETIDNTHNKTTSHSSVLANYKNFNEKELKDRDFIVNELEEKFGPQKSHIILHARVTAAKYSDPVIQKSLLNIMENIPYIAESMAFEINFYQMMFGASQMSKENENYEVNPYKTIDYNMNEEKFKRFMEKVIIEYNSHKNNSKKQSSQYDDMYFNILTSPHGNVYVNILNDYKDEKVNNNSELIQEIKTMSS